MSRERDSIFRFFIKLQKLSAAGEGIKQKSTLVGEDAFQLWREEEGRGCCYVSLLKAKAACSNLHVLSFMTV
jgi:hypothetical protein